MVLGSRVSFAAVFSALAAPAGRDIGIVLPVVLSKED